MIGALIDTSQLKSDSIPLTPDIDPNHQPTYLSPRGSDQQFLRQKVSSIPKYQLFQIQK
jgi:hypothetical protein